MQILLICIVDVVFQILLKLFVDSHDSHSHYDFQQFMKLENLM